MPRLVAAFASVGLFLVLGVAQADDAKKELEKLQGTWEIIEVVNSGHAIPAERLKGGQVVFKGDEMIVKEGSGDKDPRKFRIKLDPSKKPKALDTTAQNGKYKGEVTPAIYQLDGDTLKFCSPNGSEMKERPKDFKSEEGSLIVLLTLKRLKQ